MDISLEDLLRDQTQVGKGERVFFTSFASILHSFLIDGLFRSQGTQVDVVHVCEKSSMPSLFVCVSVAAVVVAVLTAVPVNKRHKIEFYINSSHIPAAHASYMSRAPQAAPV